MATFSHCDYGSLTRFFFLTSPTSDLYGADDIESPTVKELGDDTKTQEDNQGSSSSKTGTGIVTSSIPTYTSDLGTDATFQLDEEQEQTQDPDQDTSGSSSLSSGRTIVGVG